MAKVDKLYHSLAEDILANGYEYHTDNRPQPCVQLSDYHMTIPLDTFPLLTTKKMFTKGIVEELLWFLRGEDNIKPLLDKKVHIWNQDAYNYYKKFASLNGGNEQNQILFQNSDNSWRMFREDEFVNFVKTCPNANYNGYTAGDVGRNYGVQWRDWTETYKYADEDQVRSYDQITHLLGNLMQPNPINRRHIVTAWNPAETGDTALPPCHWAWEVIPRPYEGEHGFDLKWHQRSVDTFLGLPFNIASYGVLAHIIGSLTGMKPLRIIGDLSNVHFYGPHIEVVEEQLNRSTERYKGTTLSFSDNYLSWADVFKLGGCTFDEFLSELSHEDFIFNNYDSYTPLKGDMFAPTE